MKKPVVKGFQVGHQVDQSGPRTVYRAVHMASGTEVYLTVFQVKAGPTHAALMKRARMSTKLRLPTITVAKQYGSTQEGYFFYTHVIHPSVPISQALASLPEWEERQAAMLAYVLKALESVEYIHSARATHRDLQTRHLRVDGKDQVFLDGFINPRPKIEGRNLMAIVHLPYLAPEQLKGAPADRRTDIYAMGMILFELAAGRLPYESNYAKIEDFRQGIIPSPSRYNTAIPPELERVIVKAIAPRAERFRHVGEMADALTRLQRQNSIWKKLAEFRQLFGSLLVRKN